MSVWCWILKLTSILVGKFSTNKRILSFLQTYVFFRQRVCTGFAWFWSQKKNSQKAQGAQGAPPPPGLTPTYNTMFGSTRKAFFTLVPSTSKSAEFWRKRQNLTSCPIAGCPKMIQTILWRRQEKLPLTSEKADVVINVKTLKARPPEPFHVIVQKRRDRMIRMHTHKHRVHARPITHCARTHTFHRDTCTQTMGAHELHARTHTHTHTQTNKQTSNTHRDTHRLTQAHTHTRTHAQTEAHTRTHTYN